MQFNKVCLESISCHLPQNVVPSTDLEKRLAPVYEKLKLPYGRLEMMSGIRERRFWNNGVYPSEISSVAGEKAIEKSGLDRSEIGCLICASVCRDFLEPATASVIHHNLKLPQEAMLFDVSNACLGVLNGMVIIANMIELGQIRAGLVVAGENGGPLIDNTIETLLADPNVNRSNIKTSFASLTIGSGAAAVLLTHRDFSKSQHKLLGGEAWAATQFNDLCRGNADSGMDSESTPLMETDAETLMKHGCRLAGETWEKTRIALKWDNDAVDRVFCHQVGIMHRKLLYETLGLPLEKDFSTLEFLGNTGAASLPATLALGEEAGCLAKGNKAALLGIGSGLNCLMLGVEW
ncbi:MAG: 3-oxoacyl-ACP synthase III [Nitrospinota bacterium]|nr:3-oxoacyl-ACP synthase III [Nitrospinota bacterium]